MNAHTWLAQALAGLVSIVQAASLRDRYYTAVNRVDTLETAIEDIARINASLVSARERQRLIGGVCDGTQDR
jgi:hypothetical protein